MNESEKLERLKIFEDRFGTVEYKGIKLYLTSWAMPSETWENTLRGDLIIYKALAEDKNGKKYQVIWETVDGWQEHIVGEDGECIVPGCNGFCEDEGNACNWDIYTVTKY